MPISKFEIFLSFESGANMKTIVKERYLERIKALKDTPDIKIITGIRCSGKSNLMQMYIEHHALHRYV